MPVIYQLTGHGETALSGSFSEAVQKANVTLQTLNLLEADAVPDDAQCLIINGPSSDFSNDDADKVIDYLQAGGNVLATVNAQADQELSNFERVLAEYGLSLVKGIVAEGDSGHFYQNPFYLLPEVQYTDYTASAGSDYIFAPYVRAISYPESGDGISYEPLLSTSESAVSKADTANATTYEYEDGDEKGPFSIAVAAVKQAGEDADEDADENAGGRLLLYGSMEIFSENADQMVSGNNAGIFADALKQVVSTDDMAAIVIPVKSYDNSRLMVSAFSGRLAGLSIMIFIPLALLAAGVVIWIRRRKR